MARSTTARPTSISASNRRPTIDETIAYYRERKIGLVMFTVDSEAQLGRRRIPNEEICRGRARRTPT